MATGSIKTTNGLLALLNAHYLGTSNAPTSMSVGISTATPTTGDAAMNIPIPISGYTVLDECDTADWTESADAIAEATNTTTFKRQPDGTNVTSLDLGKDGTSATTFSYNVAVTSFDGTNQYVGMWLYIVDKTELASTGTAVEIKVGSDASNYYSRYRTQAQLSNGWNYIVLDISNPDNTTSSPVIASLDYIEILFTVDATSDTIASGNLIMDSWHYFDLQNTYKAIEATYPTVNTTTLTGEVRMKLGTTDANSFDISESGSQASDETLQSHNVTNPNSKSPTDLFTFVEKSKIRNSGGTL